MSRKLRYILLAALSALALSLLMGVPTAVISTPLFSRMIPVTPLDYAFLLLTSGLV